MDETSTVLRYLFILEIIPRFPKFVTTSKIREKLSSRNFKIVKRTIERDLRTLEENFKLTFTTQGRENRWSYKADALSIMAPAMDEHTALSFQLIKDFLQPLLPTETLEVIKPWVKKAGEILSPRQGNAANWQDKIYVLPSGPWRLSPRTAAAIHKTIYDAILNEKVLKISYLSRGETMPKEHIVSPLGLVVRDHLVYFVANFSETATRPANQLYLALHRVEHAEELENIGYTRPLGFSLKSYAMDNMGFPMGMPEIIELKLRLDQQSVASVSESPISERQTLEMDGEHHYLLTAVVQNTHDIRQWIRSMGKSAEVLEPGFLREEFKNETASMMSLYGL